MRDGLRRIAWTLMLGATMSTSFPAAGETPGLDERPVNTTCLAFDRPEMETSIAVDFEAVFNASTYPKPVALLESPTVPGRLYLVLKRGTIHRGRNDPFNGLETVLDFRDEVDDFRSGGLLGMAFHPDFIENGEIFVYYTADEGDPFTSVLSRFRTFDGGLTIDPESEEVLLTLPQPHQAHQGGGLAFGNDGYLYLGLGDGGLDGSTAQDLTNLFGTMIRIDLDGGVPYAIPSDNPFAMGGPGLPEIWAWGFRNPWRWSFDRVTGNLWLGDVGGGVFEEVNLVRNGRNYGWPAMEGFECADTCDPAAFEPPVVTHLHTPLGGDGRAIMGGYVYRGTAIPELEGRYVYGDLNGNVWAPLDDGDGGLAPELLASEVGDIRSWAEDAQNELYVLTGGIQELVPGAAVAAADDDFPTLLSETGCMDPDDPTQPGPGLIPYDVNVELWSDGATKQRWIALPEGSHIEILDDGDWELPIGSVLVKNFYVDDLLIETRLLVRHEDGDSAGSTATNGTRRSARPSGPPKEASASSMS